jgi:hypothetical protein
MKIEYLTQTNPAHPKDSILRILDFDSSEACQFRAILSKLADGSITKTDLSGIPFIAAIADCHLVLNVGLSDKGIIVHSENTFECILTKNSWEDAVGLVEPFCEGNLSGYQWLYNLNTNIDFLFSPSGDW